MQKFVNSNLFCSKVIEEKPLGVRLDPPPPVKQGLRISQRQITMLKRDLNVLTDIVFTNIAGYRSLLQEIIKTKFVVNTC